MCSTLIVEQFQPFSELRFNIRGPQLDRMTTPQNLLILLTFSKISTDLSEVEDNFMSPHHVSKNTNYQFLKMLRIRSGETKNRETTPSRLFSKKSCSPRYMLTKMSTKPPTTNTVSSQFATLAFWWEVTWFLRIPRSEGFAKGAMQQGKGFLEVSAHSLTGYFNIPFPERWWSKHPKNTRKNMYNVRLMAH